MLESPFSIKGLRARVIVNDDAETQPQRLAWLDDGPLILIAWLRHGKGIAAHRGGVWVLSRS